MDGNIFFGGSVVAAVVAGAIALFAPCCISVMLPAYFATSFNNRRRLVAMTLLFAAGVSTVILPIAMGAAAIRRLIAGEHTLVFVAGGAVMLGLALYLLFGGQVHLPMPGRRAGGVGPLSVYSLGLFSGLATSCCAPVLAGVIALSGVASSFGVAMILGSAYVFGMVAPLLVISVLWDAVDWRSSGIFRPRAIVWRLGPLHRSVSATNLASGVLLSLMGLGMIWIGLTTDGMPASSGWQASLTARLDHEGKRATAALGWLPGWAALLLLLLIIGALARRAMREVGWSDDHTGATTSSGPLPGLEASDGMPNAGARANARMEQLEHQGTQS